MSVHITNKILTLPLISVGILRLIVTCGSRFLKDSPGPTVAAMIGEATIVVLPVTAPIVFSQPRIGKRVDCLYSAAKSPTCVLLLILAKTLDGSAIEATRLPASASLPVLRNSTWHSHKKKVIFL